MLILGIHGPSRSGKDTVCKILVDKFPMIKFEKQGFADALKISAAKAIGLEGTDAELVSKMDRIKESGQIRTPFNMVSGRKFLQLYGTEAHRDMFGDDYLLDQVILDPSNPRKRVAGAHRTCDVLLIPDVRYQNEIGRVIDSGGELWKVRREVPGTTTGHASEGKLTARWDFVIDNNEGFDDLEKQVVVGFTPIANKIVNNRIERAIGT